MLDFMAMLVVVAIGSTGIDIVNCIVLKSNYLRNIKSSSSNRRLRIAWRFSDDIFYLQVLLSGIFLSKLLGSCFYFLG